MTFAGNASALGYRPIDEARLNVIVHTKVRRLYLLLEH